MDDTGLGGFWALVVPRFGSMFSGDVEAVTPILVIVIWGVALWAFVYALLESRRAQRLIDESAELIEGLDPDELWARRSAVLTASRSRSRAVQDAWSEFDGTLVDENRRLHNTVDAAEFFNEHRFAPKLFGNRFLHAAPTALTTLGLLGTFLGLTVGLSGLDLGSTSDELRTGIQTLVDGAALGFTASLWGVAMSLLTNVSERWMEGRVARRLRALQADINHLFRIKSPEQSLSDIALHSSESKEALQVLHEKIGSALQESVQHVGDSTSRAVTDAIQGSLAPIMADLAKRAADQSADVFREISGQLTASFNEIGVSLARELQTSSESMRSTLDYMGERLSQHADEHLERLNALQEATAAQMRAVNEATERQLVMLDESLPRIVSGLDRAATLVGSATQGMETVTTGFARVSSEISETSASLARMLADAIGTMDELAGKTTTAAQALAQQQGTVTELTQKTVDAVQVLEQASRTLSGGFDGMRSAQEAFLADLQRQLAGHTQQMSGWLTTYGDEVSKQTTKRMDEWNTQTERFTSTMLNATQALSDAIDELGVQRTTVDERSAVA
ncbi:anti-phage ZorAB system protein ZorA [Cellulomonas cellasea]|uniref:MotA/TolQ/ExbB proton channel domain-containing protein n=1 Tax=Cellulomonas cellasea TaxID=43670 RepID=A0A7W4UG71_9CELL|nr:anti-phage ZorAB system protein ZorA [Cellulomonas cellasea]MBB2922998.1 hypothetical protein [Cellulomonas cellasea]